MRGISMKHPGSADVLTEVDVPRPIPKAGELLLKVHTAAVNRTDIMRRENTALQAPYPILGVEVAGEVIE
ncbi:MAG: NAD(P)H-quinone oxidoreductase, partial [Enterococcus faecium]|nr:NAD(P)H-quinone oxidoreductase [Enterococcus faecium]